MAQILDGKELAKEVRAGIKRETKTLISEKGILPGLAVILVGDDPASQIYVGNKEKACIKAGFYSRVIRMSEDITQNELEDTIRQLNEDTRIHGILLQSPIPKRLDEEAAVKLISADKDVDGFHEISAGRLFLGREGFVPCTPKGIIRLLDNAGISCEGKRAVVIGRSSIVGKPVAMLLLARNATVTICHSRTQGIADVVREADIVVAALGKAKFVTADMVKEGAVVIDVGINRTPEGIVGDVDYEDVAPKASYITPVPGGVGPMTIAMLMENTLIAARNA